MQKFLYVLLFPLFFSCLAYPQVSKPFAERFINDLLTGTEPGKYVHPDELKLSQRLGISYDSVEYKFLISYDIDGQLKEKIKSGYDNYQITVEKLGENFSKIVFSAPEYNYTRQFYFNDSLLVSPPYYFSRSWHKTESKYFIFYQSDKSLFNDYSMRKLDEFVESSAAKLGCTDAELIGLSNKKIYYFLCKDENEVERLTGYKARGNYILAYDYIVTTFNCHYHEIVHLLMNYRLKNIPLYTHPFLQEGLAVALGGRGGLEAPVVLGLGKFLYDSEFLNYTDILSYNNFTGMDASMTYPACGLYNLFLLERIGFDAYSNIYRKNSGSFSTVSNSIITANDLPSRDEFGKYLNNYIAEGIQPFIVPQKLSLITETDFCSISMNDSMYFFEIKDNILLSGKAPPVDYISKKFHEEMKDREYKGEKYLLKANENEISFYNLYTNNLIVKYSAGFSAEMKPVVKKNGYYIFSVRKSLFDEDLKSLVVIQ